MRLLKSLCVVSGLLSSIPFLGQEAKETPKPAPRVFVHTRGMGRPTLEAWKDGPATYYRLAEKDKHFRVTGAVVEAVKTTIPDLPTGGPGLSKFRNGKWWYLDQERSALPEGCKSTLYYRDPVEKKWRIWKEFDFRVANFEMLADEKAVLFGVRQVPEDKIYLAAQFSMPDKLDFLEEVKLPYFRDMFWNDCQTTIDNSMAYAYFPFTGLMCGIDRATGQMKTFKTPWTPIDEPTIKDAMEKAGKKDCFISAIDHPGLENCYFIPGTFDEMVFVYKVLDVEQEVRIASATGSRPVVERVGAILLSPTEPSLLQEWDTPSRLKLEHWWWSPKTKALEPVATMVAQAASKETQKARKGKVVAGPQAGKTEQQAAIKVEAEGKKASPK